jgi:hypothetical protein
VQPGAPCATAATDRDQGPGNKDTQPTAMNALQNFMFSHFKHILLKYKEEPLKAQRWDTKIVQTCYATWSAFTHLDKSVGVAVARQVWFLLECSSDAWAKHTTGKLTTTAMLSWKGN